MKSDTSFATYVAGSVNCCNQASLTMPADVKSFLSVLTRALRRARHFALLEKVPYPTKARSQSVSGRELSPTHASLRSKRSIMIASSNSPRGERAAQSITRCLTAHQRLFRAGPRADRTSSTARSPIPCATSNTDEPLNAAPSRLLRFFFLDAAPDGNTCGAILHRCES